MFKTILIVLSCMPIALVLGVLLYALFNWVSGRTLNGK